MKEEIANLKRQRILEIAGRHFNDAGYENTQISAIAKEAEVSIGTIYSLFENKEGLLVAYINSEIENAYQEMIGLIEAVEDPEEKLKIMTRQKFKYVSERKKNLKEVLNKNPMFLVQTSLGEGCPMRRVYELIESILRVMAESVPLKSNDFTQMAYNLKALSNGYIERWAAEEDFDFCDKADEAVEFFLNGIKQ